jgi:PAS domain S-box-containing protein
VTNSVAFLNAEEIVSHTIRANHEILSSIERAKTAMEDITQNSPDLFGIMTLDGLIIRGNRSLAKLLGVHEEDISHQDLSILFLPETWHIIHKTLLMGPTTENKATTLELPLDRRKPNSMYHWTFSNFDAVSERRSRLITFVGKDVSALREYEKKLAIIFSAIPLGIVTIDRSLRIEAPYSSYAELLLDRRNLHGQPAEELIFSGSLPFMSKQQLEGMKAMFSQIGEEESWYDSAKSMFPTEIGRGQPGSQYPDSWIGLSYSPVIYRGIVEKILVVMENITDRVKQRQRTAHLDAKEKKIARLIVDLEAANPVLLGTCLEDMDVIFANLFSEEQQGSVRSVCNALHGMKGVARTVNLSRFKELIHSVEHKIMQMIVGDNDSVTPDMKVELEKIKVEWEDIKRYLKIIGLDDQSGVRALSSPIGPTPSSLKIDHSVRQLQNLCGKLPVEHQKELDAVIEELQQIDGVFLEKLVPRLQAFVQVTAQRLKRAARLECRFGGTRVSEDAARILVEVFYHLITNALDHGVEASEERVQLQKPETATITITATPTGNQIYFSVTDDGRGIDTEKVLAKALERGLVHAGMQLPQEGIWQLCMESELSTARTVTETSGRGIGLNAADERVRILGGKGLLVASSVPGQGTRFEFAINSSGAGL